MTVILRLIILYMIPCTTFGQNINFENFTRYADSNTYTTNTNSTSSYLYYTPGYKNYNTKNLKTKKLPQVMSSDGLLKNLDNSYWTLKFCSHPDIALINQVDLHIKDNQLFFETYDIQNDIIDKAQHILTPIHMFKPNEGIFAYPDKHENIFFIYMHLYLPHLLGVKIVNDFEEAHELAFKSITEIGVFTLR